MIRKKINLSCCGNFYFFCINSLTCVSWFGTLCHIFQLLLFCVISLHGACSITSTSYNVLWSNVDSIIIIMIKMILNYCIQSHILNIFSQRYEVPYGYVSSFHLSKLILIYVHVVIYMLSNFQTTRYTSGRLQHILLMMCLNACIQIW